MIVAVGRVDTEAQMLDEPRRLVSRRGWLRSVGLGAAGVGLAGWPSGRRWAAVVASQAAPGQASYVPPAESDGGWRVADPGDVGVDAARLAEAIAYHDAADATRLHGGAIVVVHQGHLIAESYVTGSDGGPRPWTPATCNAVASTTKSVFGTAVGVFLDEHAGRVNLETPLVGSSRDDSLVPQIWDQPLTDPRKTQIQVKHVLSMTSGHINDEPWRAPNPRHYHDGYSGAFQMHEYCFGWWRFEGIPDQHTLLFEPGTDFTYSNFGMEQMALAMRNLSGQQLGPYVYDRVLEPMGLPRGLRDAQYRHIPEHNFGDQPGWGVGGSEGCDAYGTDGSASPYGYNSIAGATFRCTARDLARLGYLWLNQGRWGDRQLVPQAWMDLATRRFVRDDGSTPNPYGYTFWTLDDWDGVPADAFSSRGFNINDCYVVPTLDLVVARLGNTNPPRAARTDFTQTLLRKVVSAMPALA